MARLMAPGRHRALLTLVGSALVVGCVAVSPVARPGDFPLHSGEGPYRLHWRLEREQWSARAVGLVETGQPERDRDLVVELRGIDKRGRVISRGFARTYRGQFTADVRARGDEGRFEVVLAGLPAERGGR